jgi:hypothetical protein
MPDTISAADTVTASTAGRDKRRRGVVDDMDDAGEAEEADGEDEGGEADIWTIPE